MQEGKKIEVSVYIRGWAEFATLVGIGLINLPKIWGASLAPPVQASLRSI